MTVFRVYNLFLDFDSIASRFVYLQLRFLRAFNDNFQEPIAISYSAISSAEASGSTLSSYGRNSELDSSEFALGYIVDPSEDFVSDQETEERLDVDETDIVLV